MIFEFQISASSLRQLSILRFPAWAIVRPTSSAAKAAPARKPLLNALFISVSLFTGVRPLLKLTRRPPLRPSGATKPRRYGRGTGQEDPARVLLGQRPRRSA